MRTPITPGKRLRNALNGALAPGVEWTEGEALVLDLIESAGDRLAVLQRLFDAEVAKADPSSRRITELAAEVRQTEASIAKWSAELDPYMARQPKSKQHQAAAYSRWHGGAS